MRIDIDMLTEAELRALNHRIVERLRFLQQSRVHTAMMKYQIGDKVCFCTREGETIFGTVLRYNKKTIAVRTVNGDHWNVSPHFMVRLPEVAPEGEPSHAMPKEDG